MRKKDRLSSSVCIEIDAGIVVNAEEEVLPVVVVTKKDKSKNKYNLNRTNHNESEKSRREQLRKHLDRLKEVVPTGPDEQKHTTSGLLARAKHFIRSLESKELKHRTFMESLKRDQRYLKRRLGQLQHLARGGAIDLGGTILLSGSSPPSTPAPTQPSQSSSTPGSVPHILKRKQLLMPSGLSRGQTIQTIFTDINLVANVVQHDNVCFVIDELEQIEGLTGQYDPNELVEIEAEELVSDNDEESFDSYADADSGSS